MSGTYNDGMQAATKGGWILDRIKPGEEYATDPEADNLLRLRVKNVFQRHRYLQGISTVSLQNGQTAYGGTTGFDASDGSFTVGPAAAAAQIYVCEEDDLSPVEPGAGIQKQAQTWVHYGRWGSFDPDLLTGTTTSTTTTTGA
jgi:hypothetical protein